MVDVVNKRTCVEENCLKQPRFNFNLETKGIYCVQHKKKNMVDVITKRKYLEENCFKRQ